MRLAQLRLLLCPYLDLFRGEPMKTTKLLIAILLSLCLVLGMTGCSDDHIKDDVLNGFNDLLHHFSQYALTEERDLQGDKTKGDDTYTGSYSAEYEDFSDVEYIFGGTGLDRDKGKLPYRNL